MLLYYSLYSRRNWGLCGSSWDAGWGAVAVAVAAVVAAGGGSEILSNMLVWCRENKRCVCCKDCWTFLSSSPILDRK